VEHLCRLLSGLFNWDTLNLCRTFRK